jgi:choline transport protein
MQTAVCYLQLAWFVIMVTVAACAPAHNDSKFVFRTWINETGWENNVICFITGLVNPLYSLGGLDGITVSRLVTYTLPLS